MPSILNTDLYEQKRLENFGVQHNVEKINECAVMMVYLIQ